MNLGTVIRKTLPSITTQARALLILIAAGAALLLVMQSVLAQSASRTSDLLTGDAALRTIELNTSLPNGTPTQLTGAQLAEIAAEPSVDDVRPWLQVGVQAADEQFPLAPSPVLWMTPRISAVQPPVIHGQDGDLALGPDDVLLPAQLEGESLEGLADADLTISYSVKTAPDAGESRNRTVHVAGFYDPTLQGLDGPSAIYASQSLVFELSALREGGNVADFDTTYTFPKFYVTVDRLEHVEAIQRDLTSDGFAVGTLSRSENLPGLVQFLRVISTAVGALLIVFSLGCGFSIGASLTRYRQREIGLYRALGWTRRRLAAQYGAQFGLVGLMAGVTGTLAGVVLSVAASLLLRGSTVMGLSFADSVALPSWPWVVLAALAPVAGLLVGSVIPMRKAVRIDPDEALRVS